MPHTFQTEAEDTPSGRGPDNSADVPM
ncbi:hypothetical protein RV134_210186 [Roseovarius sp. EC-HK134]|nr:hypothetical protein RV134_210186 [Roseovarius sp. EC-HK134]